MVAHPGKNLGPVSSSNPVELLRQLQLAIRKWRAIYSIYFQDGIAYRASGLIWVMTDVATGAVMPLVWATAAGSGLIQGFNAGDFVLYYLCLLLLQSFVTSHMLWDLAVEIREGQFSTMLLRPIGLLQLMFFRNLAWRCIRPFLFLPFFILLLWAYRGYLGEVHLFLGWQFWVVLILGHVLSFIFVMALALIALWTQEALAIFELYYVPMLFLSGQLFPIALLPGWAKNIAYLTPFYFTTGAPTELIVGRMSLDRVPSVIAIQLAWIAGSYLGWRILWAKGLRHYTGVGM